MLAKKLVHLAQQLTQSKVQGHIALLSPSDKISNKKTLLLSIVHNIVQKQQLYKVRYFTCFANISFTTWQRL